MVQRSQVTVTWNPSCAGVVNQWTVIVSPAFMTNGECVAWLSTSMALNAVGSLNFEPACVTLNTGEQAV